MLEKNNTPAVNKLCKALQISKEEAYALLGFGEEMFRSYPDVITVDDMQEMLHIGRNTAYQLLRDHRVPSIKVGKKYIIPKSSVIDFLRKTS